MVKRCFHSGLVLVLSWALLGVGCVRDNGNGKADPTDMVGQDAGQDARIDGNGGADGTGDQQQIDQDNLPADLWDMLSDARADLLDAQGDLPDVKPDDVEPGDLDGVDDNDLSGADLGDDGSADSGDSPEVVPDVDDQDTPTDGEVVPDVEPDAGPECGDGVVEGSEECDELNAVDGDGCDTDCTYTKILKVEAAFRRVCVLIEGGRVRCWGQNNTGQLGYGHTEHIGDDELPASAGDVGLPAKAVDLSLGDAHACVLTDQQGVLCWGQNGSGQLGYGNKQNQGDDEFLIGLPEVPVGGVVIKVSAGGSQTCALLNNGKVRCWGAGNSGQLGYGNVNAIGDDEVPAAAGDVPLGAAATALATGIGHTCAIGADGAVRCWGSAFNGQLGYGNSNAIGDNEMPSSAGVVQCIPAGSAPDTKATALALGFGTCALFDSGHVTCWGRASEGQLGQGNTTTIGDDEFPSVLSPIALGGKVASISAGDSHVCALLDNQKGICWGANTYGQLGYGNLDAIGDNELPTAAGYLDFDSPIVALDAGGNNTCAVLANNEVRCWGDNGDGQLGQGNDIRIGDDELPKSVPAVKVF